ncbi:MAG: M50 family metallopeptidase [Pyrinomonadaceae bacterium]
MPISYKLADDARPQVSLLLIATAVSVGIWVVSWFLPIAAYVVYPLQLFATFIHESSHALTALITGNAVMSLTVSPDGSGAVWSQSSGFSGLLISSAGYIGTTAFGTILLAWMRFGWSSRLALYISAGSIAVMTIAFGFLAPFWNFLENVTFGSVVFTIFSGAVLAAGLAAVAKFASAKWVNFALAFLAVQCLLNAIFSLRDLFFISASGTQQTDAANMAAATGIPSLVWVFLWIVISLVMITIGMRLYAVGKGKASKDSLFVD